MKAGMSDTDLSHLARSGARLVLRVTPRAARNRVLQDGGLLRVQVTAVPEDGKANAATLKLLARALGLPRSRLRLVRGQRGRDKIVEIL